MKHVGLIGFPVRHSLSPHMQNAAFKALKIDACYELWETPSGALEARVNALRACDMLGANVTIPHKEAVLPWLDEITPQAGRIGAVNTIVNRAGRLVGYNTDAPGFLRAVQEKAGPAFELAGKAVVILGNGGAARGAAIALLDSQVGLLSILGRDEGRIETLLRHIRRHRETGSLRGARLGTVQAEQYLAEAAILVNTTSVGLQEGDETILIEVEHLAPTALVMDMIFNPPATPLLRTAARRGCAVLNGLSMLLYQGTLAFELWTGQNAPVDVMRAALGLV